MTAAEIAPAFALDMSAETLTLYERTEDDTGWVRLGRAEVTGRQSGQQMSVLRRIATAHDRGTGLRALLMVPADQALWLRYPIAATDPEGITHEITVALGDETDCDLDELRFDWRKKDEGVEVAVLGTDTQKEAETFAKQHGFAPVAVVARHPDSGFPDTAWFGLSHLPQTANGQPRGQAPSPDTIQSLPAAVPDAPPTDETGLTPAQRVARIHPIDARDATRMPPPTPRPSATRPVVAVLSAALVAGLAIAAYVLPSDDTPVPLPMVMEEAPTPTVSPVALPDRPDRVVSSDVSTAPLAPAPTALPSPTQTPVSPPPLAAAPAQAVAAISDLPTHFAPHPQVFLGTLAPAATTIRVPGIPVIAAADAFSLGDPAEIQVFPTQQVMPLPQRDTVFDIGPDGFVRPSVNGSPAPGGYVVTAGAPLVPTRPRPVTEALADAAPALGAEDNPLRYPAPQARPADFKDQVERALYGGYTIAELSRIRPAARDAAAGAAAAARFAALRPQVRVATADTPRPKPRPNALIQQAQTRTALAAASVATKTTTPTASSADVARQATDKGALRLNRLNLLGTIGKPDAMRALVRLPSGRVLSLTVGDRLDGGRVVAIIKGELRYAKGGRTIALTMP